MKRLASLLAPLAFASLMLAAAPASAEDKEFNAKGTVEIGGRLGFESGDGATIVEVQPTFGYFLASSFELLGGLRVNYNKIEGADAVTDYGLFAGAGYFIPLASVYLGPQATVGFGHNGLADKSEMRADGTLALKIPFGNAALVFVGAGYRYVKVFDVGSRSTIAGDIGFSLFF